MKKIRLVLLFLFLLTIATHVCGGGIEFLELSRLPLNPANIFIRDFSTEAPGDVDRGNAESSDKVDRICERSDL